MPSSETVQHRTLKRLALLWAQANGYVICAAEVSLPNLQFRLDVAGYKPAMALPSSTGAGAARRKVPSLGTTAIFECKQARLDFVRDARCAQLMLLRLAKLEERKARSEEALKIHCPSLRNGDSLFAEYESYDFGRAGYEVYEKVLAEIRTISQRLYRETKFEKLYRWKAANLHYVVAEAGLIKAHEVPAGWGLLVREGPALELHIKPTWQDIAESGRLLLLQRIAQIATRSANREHQIEFTEITSFRRWCAPRGNL